MLLIRTAEPTEFASIGRLSAYAYASVLKFGDPYIQTLTDARGRAAVAELWVAIAHEQIVGTVTLCRPGSSFAQVATSDELEVRMLAITSLARGQGIGARIMAAAQQTAHVEGLSAVVLSVVESNVDAAGFYEHIGYTRVPERDWQPVPDITLQTWRCHVSGPS